MGAGAPGRPPRLVVMGVSGSGKTTAGLGLSQRLRVPFEDGDDLHPASNVALMRAGRPLDDEHRRPWLDRVGEWLAAHPDGGVIACSALKRAYRDRLRSHAPGLVVVHLDGERGVIAERQAGRPGHFMPSSLLGSQLATLEPLAPDEDGVVVDVTVPGGTPELTVDAALAALAERGVDVSAR